MVAMSGEISTDRRQFFPKQVQHLVYLGVIYAWTTMVMCLSVYVKK